MLIYLGFNKAEINIEYKALVKLYIIFFRNEDILQMNQH